MIHLRLKRWGFGEKKRRKKRRLGAAFEGRGHRGGVKVLDCEWPGVVAMENLSIGVFVKYTSKWEKKGKSSH